MNRNDPEILDRLDARFPGTLERVTTVDQPTVIVPKEMILAFLGHVRDLEGYALCLDELVVDNFPAQPRFELVYHLYHPAKYARLRVKTRVGVDEEMPSATGIWPGTNWPEREAFDLFGIRYTGHPQLTRIYMPDDWDGHPLRKDYPLAGNRVD
ncbi:MAG: NADH-quinone oxidoreductase subunit C [Sulfobacillus sp.]